jgi:hypothetical protein
MCFVPRLSILLAGEGGGAVAWQSIPLSSAHLVLQNADGIFSERKLSIVRK